MALTRSASGPGGLSINTGSANSLFGSNTSQAPASGGLFGGASKSAGGLFGSSTATTAAPQSQGAFGATTGGLFGSTNTTSAPQSGGLFGSAAAASQAQPQQTGGLFGSAPAASQPQQTGSLFGSSTTANQPQQSGGLFGGLNNTSQPQQSSGLFGGLGSQPTQNQGASTGGLFGSSMGTTQPQNTGLFGASLNKPSTLFNVNQQAQAQQPQQNANTPFAGGLTMGQGTQNQQSVPGVRIDISNIRSTTRFNDLHDDLQKQIENIDKVILAQAQQSNDINAIMPSHDEQLSFIPDNTNFLTRKLIGVESSLESDAESVALVRTLVESDAENAKLSFRAVDNLKLPQQYHHQGIWNAKATPPNPTSPEGEGAQDIVSFFSQTADEMNSTLSTYQSRIREIEQHLRGVEAQTMHQAQLLTSGGDDRGQSLRELSAVLRDFEQGILGVAGSVGKAREGVQKLQMGGFGDLGSEKAARVNGNGKRGGIY